MCLIAQLISTSTNDMCLFLKFLCLLFELCLMSCVSVTVQINLMGFSQGNVQVAGNLIFCLKSSTLLGENV